MATNILMPALSPTMTEGNLARWLKQEGDRIKAGDVIAAIESKLGYKATIQFLHGIGKGLGEHDAAGMGANNSAPPKTLAERLYPGLT